MEELDNVVLIKDYKDLQKGTLGAIVLKYDDKNFEVEFFDKELNTIGVYSISAEYIELDKNC